MLITKQLISLKHLAIGSRFDPIEMQNILTVIQWKPCPCQAHVGGFRGGAILAINHALYSGGV